MIEEGDVVLCTVERIEKTIVFVKIHYQGKELAGSIVTSEIAPGRIRNIRNYVVPKKKIVCKVLRTSGERIELSLRRVTQKDKKEVLEQYRQEKSYMNVIKTILKDNAKKAIKEIEKQNTVYDFLEEAKTNPKDLEKIVGKENAEKILKIIKTEKIKKAVLKKEFILTTTKPNGLELIKKLLEKIKNAEIKYISGGKYTIKVESANLKKADNQIEDVFKDIEKQAKQQEMIFSIK
jgi:translation initiation factor 2 alpha subunit (eIF-2alpha)